jgi:hypothetical protein
MYRFVFLMALMISQAWTNEPIAGAFGIPFGEQLAEERYLPEAPFERVGLAALYRDSVPMEERGRLGGVWAQVKPEGVPLPFREALRVEYLAQVDTSREDVAIRLVAVAVMGAGARAKAWEIGRALQGKYSCLGCPEDRLAVMSFTFQGGAGFLEVRADGDRVILDYHGPDYAAWVRTERERMRQATKMAQAEARRVF